MCRHLQHRLCGFILPTACCGVRERGSNEKYLREAYVRVAHCSHSMIFAAADAVCCIRHRVIVRAYVLPGHHTAGPLCCVSVAQSLQNLPALFVIGCAASLVFVAWADRRGNDRGSSVRSLFVATHGELPRKPSLASCSGMRAAGSWYGSQPAGRPPARVLTQASLVLVHVASSSAFLTRKEKELK